MKSKLEELKALGFDLESAESQLYPTFSMQATTLSNVVDSSRNSEDQYSLVAVLQQPIWTGGRISGNIDQSSGRLKIGKLSLLALRRQLMESTAAAYSAVQGGRKRLEAAELNVVEHERLRALISRRESGGIASSADVLLANSRLAQAQSQRIQLETTLKRALIDLLALTQLPLPGREPIPDYRGKLPPIDAIPSKIEELSPTIQQRITEVEQARISADLAVADTMPTLYAKLEQDIYTATQYGSQQQGTRGGVVLQGSLEGMGFTGWKKIKASDARVDAARREVDNSRNDVRRQVTALLNDMQNLQLVLASNESLVKTTEETLASFMRQYDAGRKSWVDVLNQQRELSEARLSLEQTRFLLEETRLRIMVELGCFDLQTGV